MSQKQSFTFPGTQTFCDESQITLWITFCDFMIKNRILKDQSLPVFPMFSPVSFNVLFHVHLSYNGSTHGLSNITQTEAPLTAPLIATQKHHHIVSLGRCCVYCVEEQVCVLCGGTASAHMCVCAEAPDGWLDHRDVGELLLQHTAGTLLHVKLLQGLRHLRISQLECCHPDAQSAPLLVQSV